MSTAAHHVVSLKVYFAIFAALMVLTAVTVAAVSTIRAAKIAK